ncbi:tripartite tricarboxylate transporter substrate binding protein [uncultured Comamonas sp.]|uniref:Bug family tripartite tricarboxylate transporter substrate binding protein n=1 Tax=uncultured Comamonas sp. TaxID=114710 RepID=UPI0025D0566D|nr:tripartite tricarboxylate transporter substrate binding protein [uncultured Comamonas sp.]
MRWINTLAACAAFALSVTAPASFAQQDWPAKPVRIVVPSAAGSAPDIMARLLATGLHRRLGQPVIAENKPGVGGALGSDQVAKAAPDGYTLVMGNIGSHAMNVGVYPKLPYDPVKDFEPVAMVAVTPSLMTVSTALPMHSLKDFFDYARQHEGQITFSSGGNGSSSHLAGEYLNLLTGLKMRHVPYKDVPMALGDVAAQRVIMMISNLPPAMSLVRAGKLRPLAVTTRNRSRLLPDVPTMTEAGVSFEQTVWFALFAPAHTPKSIIERLNREVVQVLGDPEFKEKIAASGAEPSAMTPTELRQFVAAEVGKWNKVAHQSGARAE